MNWSSWGDCIAMGGYATYVWGSYLVAFGALVFELVMLRQRRRKAFDRLDRTLKRNTGQSDETTP
jgi:heme exporter protein D